MVLCAGAAYLLSSASVLLVRKSHTQDVAFAEVQHARQNAFQSLQRCKACLHLVSLFCTDGHEYLAKE